MKLSDIYALLKPVKRRINSIVCKAILAGLRIDSDFPLCKVKLSKEESLENVELLMPYGFFSLPSNDAQLLILNKNGDKAQSVIIMASDVQGKPENVDLEDSGLYNRNGTHILLKGNDVFIKCSGTVNVNDGNLTVEN